jgi:hypothetical protein
MLELSARAWTTKYFLMSGGLAACCDLRNHIEATVTALGVCKAGSNVVVAEADVIDST